MRFLRSLARHVRCLQITLAHAGPTRTAYWAAFGFLRINRFVIFSRDLETALPVPEGGEGFELWTADRMQEWRQGRQDLPTEFYQDRIDRVSLCAVACAGEELAGLIWIYRPGDYSRMFRLQAGEAELNHGYLQPEHRHRRLFARLLAFACAELRQQGYVTARAVVHASNKPSLRAFTRAGFAAVGSVRHFFIFRPTVKSIPAAPRPPESVSKFG